MNVEIFTDGACSNNQIPSLREGGFAYIVPANGKFMVMYKYEKGATNNQMELKAFLGALEYIITNGYGGGPVTLHTDSTYVIGCFSGNKVKKNQDLVRHIADIIARHKFSVSYNYVRGHNGHRFNELCDTFAKQAIAEKNTEVKSLIIE